MSDALEARRRAILTAAADAEAARQAARARRDWPAMAGAERDLRELWQAYSALEREAAA